MSASEVVARNERGAGDASPSLGKSLCDKTSDVAVGMGGVDRGVSAAGDDDEGWSVIMGKGGSDNVSPADDEDSD